MKTQTKPNPKLAPIVSLQPRTPAGITTRPTPKPFPGTGTTTGQQHQDSTEGPTLPDSVWAEYGKSVHANQQAQARRYREIAELKRQAESLHHSMNVRATPGLVEECSNCHGHHEGAC